MLQHRLVYLYVDILMLYDIVYIHWSDFSAKMTQMMF